MPFFKLNTEIMKSDLSDFVNKQLGGFKNKPIATVNPQSTDQIIQEKALINRSLETFTFDRQKRLFSYVKMIGCYIDNNVPPFRNIWPLLGAYTEKGQWHPKLDMNLEFIGTAHYTVLKSLCYIIRNKELVIPNDPDQKYKNIIFHYAIINACIKEICTHILMFEKKLDQSLSRQIRQSNYIESLKDSVGLPNREDSFCSFNSFKVNTIDPLRNAFIHNPSIDIFWIGRKTYVVKPKYISSHKIIGKISRLGTNNLIKPSLLMDYLFEELTKILPLVWDAIYEEIKLINTHKQFHKKWYSNN